MLELTEIVDLPEQAVAVLPLLVPRHDIRHAMVAGRAELKAALAQQGVEPVGPWVSHHLRLDRQVFDFEIALPIASPFTAQGRARAGSLPAIRAARGVYCGPYEGLANAWQAFDDWILAQGWIPGPGLREYYLTGPDSQAAPQDWRTQLVRPVLRPDQLTPT